MNKKELELELNRYRIHDKKQKEVISRLETSLRDAEEGVMELNQAMHVILLGLAEKYGEKTGKGFVLRIPEKTVKELSRYRATLGRKGEEKIVRFEEK